MIEVSATDVLRRSSPALKVAGIYGTAILLLFAAEIALARTLPSQAFGSHSLTRNALPLISALSLLGIDQAVTRRLAAGDSEFGVRRAFRQRIVLSVVMSLMGALITFWMTERVGPATTVEQSVVKAVKDLNHRGGIGHGSSDFRLFCGGSARARILRNVGPYTARI